MSSVFAALPVPNFVLFPGCTVSLQFGFPALQDQLRYAQKFGGKIVVAHSLQSSQGWRPAKFGCLADIRAVQVTPHGLQAKLAGIERAEILSQHDKNGRLLWKCRIAPRQKWQRKKYPELAGMPELVRDSREKLPAELWLDVAAFHAPNLPLEQKLMLLAEGDPARRYYQLMESTRKAKKAPRVHLN